ncbi:MAG TPA: hypothetical protein VL240_13435, partial [Candidatus Binatia bacterium]|nr:hypothetical protein [Candidatus Binatia bacterium]
RHGLSSRERARRAAHDFQLALARAENCANLPEVAAADNGFLALLRQAKSMSASEKLLAGNPDEIEKTMDVTFKLTQGAAQCGPPGREDKALALLGQQREASR